MSNEEEKLIKKAKELNDLKLDYNKTEKLLKEKNFQELQQHLQDMMSKHFFETLAYNAINPIQPRFIEENALNCMKFLQTLIISKAVEDNQPPNQFIAEHTKIQKISGIGI